MPVAAAGVSLMGRVLWMSGKEHAQTQARTVSISSACLGLGQ